MALDNQTFANLERDIDDTGKFVNTKGVITPREGIPFKSAPLIAEEAEMKADEVAAKGFYLGFANEAAMRAYTPSFAETRAKLDDTKKVYRWERTSAEGVAPISGIWHDTGLSELDQAKDYTQDQLSKFVFNVNDVNVIDTSKNVYATTNDTLDFYITNKSASVQFVVKSLTGTRLQRIAVKAGESYLVYMPNWTAADYLALSFSKDSTVTAEKKLTQVQLVATNDANIKKFVVPLGFNYLFFNTKIPTVSHDVTTTLAINKYSGNLIGFDGAINPPYISESQLDISDVARNIANNEVKGFYIGAVGSANYGKLVSYVDGTIQVFAVEAGKTYAIYSTNFNSSLFAIGVSNSATVSAGKSTTPITLTDTSDANVKLLTVPTSMTHAFATTSIPSLSFDIRADIYINEGTTTSKFDVKTVSKIKDAAIRDELAQQRLDDLNIVQTSVLKNKKWITIGDSITEKNMRANMNYHDYIKADVGGMTVYNKGISGSGFHDRMNVADTLTEQNPDYITIFWGTNDFGLVRNTYALGTFMNNDENTISGRINTCLSALITKYPFAKIAIISALPRLTNYGSNASANSVGYTLKQHVDLLKQYANHYSLPFLNLYESSNLPVWVPAANQHYFTAPSLTTPDGLHPNDAGQRVIADKIKHFLESI